MLTAWLVAALPHFHGGGGNTNTTPHLPTTVTLASVRSLAGFPRQPTHLHYQPETSAFEKENKDSNEELWRSCNTPPENEPNNNRKDGKIQVSADIELEFPKEVAYDAFSDISRQASFSPWLKSVVFLNGSQENTVGATTKWTMSFMGVPMSWNAISTRQDRENGVIEWKSITGLQNNGRVEFRSLGDRTHMIMTMTFTTPRLATRILGEGHVIARVVENKMLKSTLRNFRQIVLENDWKQQQEGWQSTNAASTKQGGIEDVTPCHQPFRH